MEFDLVDKGVERPNKMTCRITPVARLENYTSEDEEESLMCSAGVGSELLTDLSHHKVGNVLGSQRRWNRTSQQVKS